MSVYSGWVKIKYMMCVRKNFTYVMKLALYNNRFALKIYSIINALTYFLIYSNDNSYSPERMYNNWRQKSSLKSTECANIFKM